MIQFLSINYSIVGTLNLQYMKLLFNLLLAAK